MFYDTNNFRFQDTKLNESVHFGRVYAYKKFKNKKICEIKIFLYKDIIFNNHDQPLHIQYSFQQFKIRHPRFVKFKGINFQSLNDSKLIEPTIITKFYSKGSLRNTLQQESYSLTDF